MRRSCYLVALRHFICVLLRRVHEVIRIDISVAARDEQRAFLAAVEGRSIEVPPEIELRIVMKPLRQRHAETISAPKGVAQKFHVGSRIDRRPRAVHLDGT